MFPSIYGYKFCNKSIAKFFYIHLMEQICSKVIAYIVEQILQLIFGNFFAYI